MQDRKFVTPVGDTGLYVLDTASWRTVKPVMDKDICVNCGLCSKFCPVNSIEKDDKGSYVIDYSFCKGCGICSYECPVKAITMEKEEK